MPLFLPLFTTSARCAWASLKHLLQQLTRPVTGKMGVGTAQDLTRTRTNLLLENAFLRLQVTILTKQVPRLQITRRERLKLLFLARLLPPWKSLLQIVQPETLLRWHRDLFKTYWKKKSKTKPHPRRISDALIALIRQLALENGQWGAERIRGELLKLGINVAKRTIQKYLPDERAPGGQTWATFLQNHAQDIYVCDFTVVQDIFFRSLHLFVVMHLATRQIVHFNVIRNPTEAWTAQKMREISPWGERPKYLICDNASVFGEAFARAGADGGD